MMGHKGMNRGQIGKPLALSRLGFLCRMRRLNGGIVEPHTKVPPSTQNHEIDVRLIKWQPPAQVTSNASKNE